MDEPGTVEDGQNSLLIQRVNDNDVGLMYELLCVFHEAFAEEEACRTPPPREGYLQKLLASNFFVVFAAMEEGRVVGGVTAYLLPQFKGEQTELYLYDLAVASTHRRRGIATSLIRELMVFGRKMNAPMVFVQADREDAPAIALYETFGTKKDVFHFDIQAPP